jgi:hypothetical protein
MDDAVISIITVVPWRTIVTSSETGNFMSDVGSPKAVMVYMLSASKMHVVCVRVRQFI